MPKVKFTKDKILEATLEIALTEGVDRITVRKLAEYIGCSTAPIYTVFNSRDELISELGIQCQQKFLEYTNKQYTEEDFLNIGVGMLAFAINHPKLYRALFIDETFRHLHLNLNHIFVGRMDVSLNPSSPNHPSIPYFDTDDLEKLLYKMHTFTHGLGVDIVTGNLPNPSLEKLTDLLGEVGGEIILATLYKKGKLEEYLQNYHTHCKEE